MVNYPAANDMPECLGLHLNHGSYNTLGCCSSEFWGVGASGAVE